jgi:hypothetical protein
LKDLATNNPNFPALVKSAMERDKNRSELIKSLSMQEKLLNVLNIISTDLEYSKEYERFVNAMSYANNDSVPTFKMALESVEELVDLFNE